MIFDDWWHGYGSAITVDGDDDHEEHAKRVAAVAWAAATDSAISIAGSWATEETRVTCSNIADAIMRSNA